MCFLQSLQFDPSVPQAINKSFSGHAFSIDNRLTTSHYIVTVAQLVFNIEMLAHDLHAASTSATPDRQLTELHCIDTISCAMVYTSK